jgi:hypothetical protein
MHSHHLQLQVGHYGIFSGRRWRTEIYAKLHDFIRTRSLEQRLFRAVRVGARCRGPLLPSTRTQQRKRPRFGRAIIPNSAKGKGEHAPGRAQHVMPPIQTNVRRSRTYDVERDRMAPREMMTNSGHTGHFRLVLAGHRKAACAQANGRVKEAKKPSFS